MRGAAWIGLGVLIAVGLLVAGLGLGRGDGGAGSVAPEADAPAPPAAVPEAKADAAPEAKAGAAPEAKAGAERAELPPTPAPSADEAVPSWTLRFVAEDGAALDDLVASVQLWHDGRAPTLVTRPASAPDVDWVLMFEEGLPQRARVRAWAPGCAPLDEGVGVEAGAVRSFALRRGVTVTGRVVDAGGEPVAGAVVSLRVVGPDGEARGNLQVQTNGEGRFHVGSRAEGIAVVIAEKRQLGRSAPSERALARGESWDAGDLVLTGSGDLRVQLVFPDGTPVDGFHLHAQRADPSGGDAGIERTQRVTDAEGRLELEGLVAGATYQLEHSAPALASLGEAGRVRAGDAEHRLVLEAARVVLRMEDADGAAVGIPGCNVEDLDRGEEVFSSTFLGPQPSITIHLAPDRRYRVSARGADGQPYTAEIGPVAAGVFGELVLRPVDPAELAALRLRLLDAAGAPLERYTAVLEPTGGGDSRWLRAPDELKDGAFRLLAPGPHELTIRDAGPRFEGYEHFPDGPRPLELVAGQETEHEWRASEGGRIELDLSGVAPLRDRHGAELQARRASEPAEAVRRRGVFRRNERSVSTANRATLGQVWQTERLLPPGSWVLRVTAEDYRSWEEAVVVRGGEVTRVRVELAPE